MNRTPTLVVDKEKCSQNIDKILGKLKKSDTYLRPHFKTHQSHAVGKIFRKHGITKIAVSSFAMADYFAQDGWQDITVAFPTNILEIDRINNLAARIRLNIVVESVEVIDFLAKHLDYAVGLFVQLDIGYHRTGVAAHDFDRISKLLHLIEANDKMDFVGFLAHAGHSYKARSEEEILRIHNDAFPRLLMVKEHFARFYPDIILSYGDTPTASVVQQYSGVNEIRAGNFVYYDLTQVLIGSCKVEEIAVTVECPIVAIHAERNEIVLYGGGVHFSKDRLDHPDFGLIYGIPVFHKKEKWGSRVPGAFIKSISQEHGVVYMPDEYINQWKVGMTMKVLPVHSCMAADLMRGQTVLV